MMAESHVRTALVISSLLASMAVVVACGGARAKPADAAKPWEPPDSYDDKTTLSPSTSTSSSSFLTDPSEPAPSEPPPSVSAPSAPAPSAPAPMPPPEPGRATITLSARALPLGKKVDATTNLGIEALFTTDGPKGPVTVEDYGTVTDHRVTEILGVQRGDTRKLRVSFQDRSTTHIVNGRQKHTVSPVSGRTYVLEARDQGLAILDDKGREVSHEEGVALSQLFRALGTPEEMPRAIPRDPMPLRRAVPSLAEALKRDVGRGVEGRVWFGQVSVTPTGTRRVAGVDCVVFAIVLQVGFETEGRKVRMDTKGEMLLRSDNAWLVSLELAGPVAVDLTERGVLLHGLGKSRLTGIYAYP
jgi:hypothetical protein